MARESLLVKVRHRLTIPARRRSQEQADGDYGSIHRGRSMDFDDLREYVLGDDVRDIDWKATARSGRPLIKRYVATRRHAVLLVVDTGRSMAALADAHGTKRDVAVLAAGVIGQLAMDHGDTVGLVAGPVTGTTAWGARVGNRRGIVYVPPLRGDVHLERLLRTVHDAIDVDGEPSRLGDLLGYVATRFVRRRIIVVIADDVDLDDTDRRSLPRLAAQHELLHCTVGDVAMTEPELAGRALRDVETTSTIPAYFRRYTELHRDLVDLAQERDQATRALLADVGAASVRLRNEATVVGSIIELLERQRLFGAGSRG